MPGTVVAMVAGYVSDDADADLRSYERPLIGEMEGYCWCDPMVSALKERDRGGAEGYEDHISSREDGSLAKGAVHVADCCGA
ncbi:hypothetical protein P8C59_000298 [Phyllachora maydis]|uniref:Uncharacterized protein n=1 Tax=Phyllachora maydis TaxID=1825666 RepID=A0AAD9HVN0_9PEZI|nr:hypothetical protein P8C59_000298 [Phyllachora maydis]